VNVQNIECELRYRGTVERERCRLFRGNSQCPLRTIHSFTERGAHFFHFEKVLFDGVRL